MSLERRVSIARRFLRSIRIDTDLGDAAALAGFVCPQSSANVLSSMAQHVSETGQAAFTWTGPYGSGKSSLAVALSALLRGDNDLQKEAASVFGQKLSREVRRALPPGVKGWRVVPVVARRDDPVSVIGEALKDTGIVARRPHGGWTESNLMTALTQAAAEKPKTHGGLVLFIDEMGKFLEAAAQDGSDIYILQQLAEAASRSNGRFIIVGVLHQAFDEYAHRLSHEMRDEWAKVQGRFIDLAVNTVGEEQIDLISRAIKSDHNPTKPGASAATVAEIVHGDRAGSAGHLASMLEGCWPLHPVVACLLGPISRRRFGQNQRSIFGFLSSSEPCGFQDFLSRASEGELYGPERLWDYLRVNLEPSILASPDGHRWALAAEALERCEALDSEEVHVKLLKAIAVIDLFKERSGLVASTGLLRCCFPDVSTKAMEAALSQLDGWSFTIFKKFIDARVIFAGSDFDIERAVRTALDEVGDVDFDELKSLAGLQPILAKRHYHETGTLRWFDVNIVPVGEMADYVSNLKLENGSVGQFLLAISTENESREHVESVCQKAARASTKDKGDIVTGVAPQSWTMIPMVRELFALERVSNDHPELAGDAVARREVSARLADLQTRIETETRRAFGNAGWFRKNHSMQELQQSELNTMASELADARFDKSPILHNELLNRQKPSVSAVSAQKKLLYRMLGKEEEPRLGIDGYPAESGLYAAIMERTGLHRECDGEWRFVSPVAGPGDTCNLAPIWQATVDYVEANADRTVPIAEVYDLWRKPPYGLKDGVMPILMVTFMLYQHENLAVYRDGVFRAEFSEVDVDYLTKDPKFIQLRWMDLSDITRRLLSGMSQVVRRLDSTSELENQSPIDVGRGLVAIYDRLPNWTTWTMQLSANAVAVRSLFKKAKDPNKFLFDDIPGLLGSEASLASDEDLERVIKSVGDGLEELTRAYSSMLTRLRDTMLSSLHVPNDSPQALDELHKRAENIKDLTGDFRLEAFIGRVARFDGSEESFEGIASLAANKPPRDWTDSDHDKAAIELADMADRFLHAEPYAWIKGRKVKHRPAKEDVVLSLDKLEVASYDPDTVQRLTDGIVTVIDRVGASRPNDIHAAMRNVYLHRLLEKPEDAAKPANGRRRAVL